MLLIIIPAVWLALALFFLALCRMAARGDESLDASNASRPAEPAAPRAVRLTVPAGRLPRRYRWTPAHPPRSHTASRPPEHAAHGGRRHA